MPPLKALLIFPIFLLLLSCEEDLGPCSNVMPIASTVGFTLIDSLTGKSLIGTDRLYHPDTIAKLNSGSNAIINGYKDTALILDYGSIDSGVDLPFKLNRTEIDTVKIEFETVEGKCFASKNLKQFFYNDVPVDSQEDGVIIEK